MTSLAMPMLRETITPVRHARLLRAAAALLLLVTVVRLAKVLPHYGQVDQSAGVWTALAADLAREGVFYRPIAGDLGYGGTRYFPLHFVLHAGLIRAGLGPVEAGLAIAFAGVTSGLISSCGPRGGGPAGTAVAAGACTAGAGRPAAATRAIALAGVGGGAGCAAGAAPAAGSAAGCAATG